MKTPCNTLVCAKCIGSLILTSSSSVQCPGCMEHHDVSPTLFVPASDVVLKVLGTLLVHCDEPSCIAVVHLKHLAEHVNSGCKMYTAPSFSPSKLTMGQILTRPLQSVPTVVEQKAAASIVKRLLHASPPSGGSSESPQPAPVVKLTTDGTVSIISMDIKHYNALLFNPSL